MTTNYNPRSLVDRYLDEMSRLRPILCRYINLIENIESNSSYLVQRVLRHEERMQESLYERERRTDRHRSRVSPVDMPRFRHLERNRNRSANINPPGSTTTQDRLNDNINRILNNFSHTNQEQINTTALHTPRATQIPITDPSLNLNFDFLTPVPIIPSESEIRRATETIQFRTLDSMHNQTCPITQQPFNENERIIRIIQCEHLFNKRALLRWFTQSTRCPVCRYDIREYNTADHPRTPYVGTEHDNGTLINNIQRSISDIILNQVPGFTGQDISGNIMTNSYLRDEHGNLLAMSEPSVTSFILEVPSTLVTPAERNLSNTPLHRSAPRQPLQRPNAPPPPQIDESDNESNESDNESSEYDNATLV